jgi:hypothetical protein
MSRIDVTVGVRNAAFRSGLEEVRSSTHRFASDIKSMFAGAFAVGAIVAGFKSVIDQGEKIGDLAKRFRVPAEELQRLGMAGNVSGTSMETVARSMQRLRQSMAEAVSGSGKAREAFLGMGISMEQLQLMTTEEVYYRIADALANTTNETDKITLATSLFGSKLAGEMIPYLEQGSERLQELGGSAGVMSEETIANLSKASTTIKQLEQTMTVAFGTMVGYVIMPFINAVKTLGAAFGGSLYAMMEVTGEFARILSMALSGNFTGAFEAVKRLGGFMEQTFRNAATTVAEEVAQIWEDPQPADRSQPEVKVSPQEQIDQEAIKLEEQLAAEREKNERAKMDRQQKINALQEDYNRLLAEAAELSGKEKTQKLIEAEKVRGQLESEQRAQAADDEREAERQRREQEMQAKRLTDEESRRTEELARAREQESEVDESNRLDAMSPAERQQYLQRKQASLFREAEEAEAGGDELTAVRKRTEAKRLQSKIESAQPETFEARRVLTVDSLQRIGGGAGMGNITDPAQRERERQTTLLERIARAVEDGERTVTRSSALLGP